MDNVITVILLLMTAAVIGLLAVHCMSVTANARYYELLFLHDNH